MAYNTHILQSVPAKLLPGHSSLLQLPGIGTGSLQLTPHGPPQASARPLLTHPVADAAGADCPSCNLVEIPFDASLPTLRM